MKTLACCLSAFVLLFLNGCTGVTFEEPQPEGVKNETAFPADYQGQYLLKSDSTIVIIQAEMILQTKDQSDSFLIKDIESRDWHLRNNKLFRKSGLLQNIEANAAFRNDSAFAYWQETDTMFRISPQQPLRFYKGQYFLNNKTDDNDSTKWYVIILKRQKDYIVVSAINAKQDVGLLKEITPVKETVTVRDKKLANDTSYTAKPTRKELFKFIKKGGFSTKDTLVPVSKY